MAEYIVNSPYRDIERVKMAIPPDTHTVIVTAPRSGTTWLQSILGHYLSLYSGQDFNPGFFKKQHRLSKEAGLPPIVVIHAVLGSQELLDYYSQHRIVLLLRSPACTWRSSLDVLTSIDRDLDSDLVLLDRLTVWEQWLEAAQSFKGFDSLTYESLCCDGLITMMGLLYFLDWPIDEEMLDRAIVRALYDNISRHKVIQSRLPERYESRIDPDTLLETIKRFPLVHSLYPDGGLGYYHGD